MSSTATMSVNLWLRLGQLAMAWRTGHWRALDQLVQIGEHTEAARRMGQELRLFYDASGTLQSRAIPPPPALFLPHGEDHAIFGPEVIALARVWNCELTEAAERAARLGLWIDSATRRGAQMQLVKEKPMTPPIDRAKEEEPCCDPQCEYCELDAASTAELEPLHKVYTSEPLGRAGRSEPISQRAADAEPLRKAVSDEDVV